MPAWLDDAVFAKQRNSDTLCMWSEDDSGESTSLKETEIADAQVVTARINGTEEYRLLLDLDGEHKYLKSSSGNGHLIFNVSMTREEHDYILTALASVGIIEPGYLRGSTRRVNGSSLRLSWVRKGEDLPLNAQ